MNVSDKKNILTGIFFIGFGAAVAYGATNYAIGSAARMGPGYFPLGLGLALALTGVGVLVSALLRATARSQLEQWPVKSVVLVLASVVLFGLLIERAGLVIALPVLVVVSSFAHSAFSWRSALLSSAVLLALSWIIFILILGLQVPLLPPDLSP
ncbi:MULTISPECIES: tripartite tricarboxylate transporter TctB family protein [unclassified Chelatococcus]|uniref:tripartite tricarboxylate transporter TctB family protein n=1 Tax=unclassified Chelatococcus TaxID=2638111 RepID=UPI001BCDF7D0|nr:MULTISPECIES: tripartite tricarboxylate transporter TctB family protein [unclassified Chelatococcus]MBS7701034.1 tripartite tricarboxylate transporter TctB family protein [Chelatococcus sp. YT9]MBX3555567.1 tripartite tricarboxylate transporter TctB family protein [Chelatococcus sp.]